MPGCAGAQGAPGGWLRGEGGGAASCLSQDRSSPLMRSDCCIFDFSHIFRNVWKFQYLILAIFGTTFLFCRFHYFCPSPEISFLDEGTGTLCGSGESGMKGRPELTNVKATAGMKGPSLLLLLPENLMQNFDWVGPLRSEIAGGRWSLTLV